MAEGGAEGIVGASLAREAAEEKDRPHSLFGEPSMAQLSGGVEFVESWLLTRMSRMRDARHWPLLAFTS
jgi:hypothetical protein